MRELKIQSLRIPNGWLIRKNELFELDSKFSSFPPTSMAEVGFEYFEDNMFVAVNAYNGTLLEFGWYPPYKKSGSYKIILVRPSSGRASRDITLNFDHNWQKATTVFEGRDRLEAIAKIEEFLMTISAEGYD